MGGGGQGTHIKYRFREESRLGGRVTARKPRSGVESSGKEKARTLTDAPRDLAQSEMLKTRRGAFAIKRAGGQAEEKMKNSWERQTKKLRLDRPSSVGICWGRKEQISPRGNGAQHSHHMKAGYSKRGRAELKRALEKNVRAKRIKCKSLDRSLADSARNGYCRRGCQRW